jgi:hypothetical protein
MLVWNLQARHEGQGLELPSKSVLAPAGQHTLQSHIFSAENIHELLRLREQEAFLEIIETLFYSRKTALTFPDFPSKAFVAQTESLIPRRPSSWRAKQ